jgi:hypothetical protein
MVVVMIVLYVFYVYFINYGATYKNSTKEHSKEKGR